MFLRIPTRACDRIATSGNEDAQFFLSPEPLMMATMLGLNGIAGVIAIRHR